MADVRKLLRSLLFTLLSLTVSGQSPNCKYIQLKHTVFKRIRRGYLSDYNVHAIEYSKIEHYTKLLLPDRKIMCILSTIVTSTSDIVCFGEEVTLTCSAEDSVRWSSDDVIGEGMSIQFIRIGNTPGAIITIGNATAEYLRDEDMTVISSLRFNATSDVSVITCMDNGANSMSKNITISSRKLSL